jgi:hypothetical protein
MALTVVQAGVGGTGTTSFPAPGSSGNVLTSNGSAWTSSTPAAGGKVLQVLQSVKTDTQSTTSTSYVDVTGMSVVITPTSTSSKILVMLNINNLSIPDANGVYVNIVRNSTTLTSSTAGGSTDTNNAWGTGGGGGMNNNDRKYSNPSLTYLDSPATTSATTYKVQFLATGSTAYFNQWATNNDQATVSSITVMEIAG